FHQHHDPDDDEQDGSGGCELVTIERGVKRSADTTGADDADYGGFAEVDIEAIEAKPDHAWHHLGLNAVIDPLQPTRASRPHRLRLRRIHVLNIFGKQFAVESDSGERERHDAGERTKAEELDEEDRQDDLLEAARHCEESTTDVVDGRRSDVLCRT